MSSKSDDLSNGDDNMIFGEVEFEINDEDEELDDESDEEVGIVPKWP